MANLLYFVKLKPKKKTSELNYLRNKTFRSKNQICKGKINCLKNRTILINYNFA